ncbi:hypothetical protein Y1Q_0004164 [Alligator mississippiensis]|uniref:Uncharacterized protein n=1 Tax=Alligator mississippiensis TaxID=8496 RepID=A0A151PIJ2_ALLMI|nr:hypothetical protein Y1Q_0004164 [Alligator mississippiensis]
MAQIKCDLADLANDAAQLQQVLDVTSKVARWMGLRFNVARCTSLHIDGRQKNCVMDSTLTIQGQLYGPGATGQPQLLLDPYSYLQTPASDYWWTCYSCQWSYGSGPGGALWFDSGRGPETYRCLSLYHLYPGSTVLPVRLNAEACGAAPPGGSGNLEVN